MKKSIHTFIFGALVIAAITVALFLGWHLGPRTDMCEMRNLRWSNQRMEEDLALVRCRALNDLFTSVVEIQKGDSDPSKVHHLNSLIDARIVNPLWPVNGPPYNAHWNRTVVAIADYRRTHPVEYADPKDAAWMQELLDRARKELERTSNH